MAALIILAVVGARVHIQYTSAVMDDGMQEWAMRGVGGSPPINFAPRHLPTYLGENFCHRPTYLPTLRIFLKLTYLPTYLGLEILRKISHFSSKIAPNQPKNVQNERTSAQKR